MPTYLVANFKSYKDVMAIDAWFDGLGNQLSRVSVDPHEIIIIAPPFPLLDRAAERIRAAEGQHQLYLAVQDLSPFPAGAYTGAVSVENLQGLPISYALVGHSERRRYFHETNQEVANKVVQAVDAGITPIVCVDQSYVVSQAAALPTRYAQACMVAYEPVEAIGTGQPVPPETVRSVRHLIHDSFGSVPVLYGGSINRDNYRIYADLTEGVLIGSASLDAASFLEIVAR